jgi:hypothetical protein
MPELPAVALSSNKTVLFFAFVFSLIAAMRSAIKQKFLKRIILKIRYLQEYLRIYNLDFRKLISETI